MKKLGFALITLLSVWILSGCSGSGLKINEPSPEETVEIKPIGDKISKELVSVLQKELKEAVNKGGLKEAINVCNMKAVPLTNIIAGATDRVVHIKRTSFKYRNPDNAPDEPEKAALEHFEKLAAAGKKLPSYYIQKIEKAGSTYFNYYKPMKVKPICLNCHGDRDKINPGTLSEIEKLYPDDKATGYKAGDFRGLIRIMIE